MRIVVTGACGKVGRRIVGHFQDQGIDTLAVDRSFSSGIAGEFVAADLQNPTDCYRLLQGADAVIHLANNPHPHYSDSQGQYKNNLCSNINIFQAACELGLKKLIFTSSVHALNGRRTLDTFESVPSCLNYLPLDADTPACPGSIYGLTKVAGEQMMKYYADYYGMQTFALRLPSMRVAEWSKPVHTLEEIRKRGYGKHVNPDEVFSYLYMDSLADIFCRILERDLPGYHLYFPVDGCSTLGMTRKEVCELFFPEVPLRCDLDKLGSFVDCSRITEELGWFPRYQKEVNLAE